MEKHRERKRNRLRDFDYSQNGYYFVTICTKDRLNLLGEIGNGRSILNEYGSVVESSWLQIPNHYKNTELEEFVIMPNHIHGIIIIVGNAEMRSVLNPKPHTAGNAEMRFAQNCTHLKRQDRSKMYLSKVIHSFKSSVTRKIRKDYQDYIWGWQKSFYDHVIRNDESLRKIRQYIINNPLNWHLDENNLNR
jgi:REP element-mobilizing transposase RayT